LADKIRVAVVGAGVFGRHHLRILNLSPNAKLAGVLAAQSISIDAVLQLPAENWRDLPFVITVEPTTEHSLRQALAEMQAHDFLLERPLAMPMEKSL